LFFILSATEFCYIDHYSLQCDVNVILLPTVFICQCTVLEVNEDKDFGTTIDVVLINGVLRKGDRIVVCTKQVCFCLLTNLNTQP
jgi:hypothetical protein